VYLETEFKTPSTVEEYQKMPYPHKLKFWSGNLHQQMRWNGESGVDEYAVFSKAWLEKTLEFEPQIETIIEDIIKLYWKNYWDADKIRKALKE
jgi:hypothetical protein